MLLLKLLLLLLLLFCCLSRCCSQPGWSRLKPINAWVQRKAFLMPNVQMSYIIKLNHCKHILTKNVKTQPQLSSRNRHICRKFLSNDAQFAQLPNDQQSDNFSHLFSNLAANIFHTATWCLTEIQICPKFCEIFSVQSIDILVRRYISIVCDIFK